MFVTVERQRQSGMAMARCAAGMNVEGCAPAVRSDRKLALGEPGTSAGHAQWIKRRKFIFPSTC
jgi:hypothetical protein